MDTSKQHNNRNKAALQCSNLAPKMLGRARWMPSALIKAATGMHRD
jgi:hypothetical protein